jgi:hypothetical protein
MSWECGERDCLSRRIWPGVVWRVSGFEFQVSVLVEFGFADGT